MGQFIATTVDPSGIGVATFPVFHSQRDVAAATWTSKPEVRLLVTIARVDLSSSEQALLKDLLTATLNWDALLNLAERHGLEALLLHHLRKMDCGFVPDQVMRRLRNNCRIIALRNLLLSAKLCEISAHLTSLQIEHIAYKGPLLAELYGNDGALRAYRDLDLLISQRKLKAVRDALLQIGFVDRYGLTPTRQAASFHSGYEHTFTSKEGIDLDVHWRVIQEFKSYALDMDGIWARKTVTPLLGHNVPALSREDLLIVLSLHAGHHGWMQLSHLCDLAQLFRAPGKFDWEIVYSHLGDTNTRRIICVSLHLLKKHWFVDLPEKIEVLISSDPHVRQLAERIEDEIWPAEKPVLTTSSLRWLLNRSAGERWRDRVRLLAGSFFIPSIEDFALFRLPPALSRFYPCLRPLRLGWKYLSTFWLNWHEQETTRLMDLRHNLHSN